MGQGNSDMSPSLKYNKAKNAQQGDGIERCFAAATELASE